MSTAVIRGTCTDARKDFGLPGGCCTSCHEDWSGGFDQPTLIEPAVGRHYEVCCDVWNAWNEKGRPNPQ